MRSPDWPIPEWLLAGAFVMLAIALIALVLLLGQYAFV